MFFWRYLAFRPVGCLLLRVGRGYLLAGIVWDFIDIRIWMIGVAHGRSPGQVGQSLFVSHEGAPLVEHRNACVQL
ncbi:hypothetical protein AB688_13245 [Pseudomonas putida]|nr:hypothetical protein AB688_13245 [Pseudomonas putida]